MKLYKNIAGTVFAYESDGSQDAFIPNDLIEITEAEADALRAPSAPTIDDLRALTQCASWQFKRALTQLNLRSAVETLISSADQDTRDMWASAANFKRISPFIMSAAAALNKTPEEVDAVFSIALEITE
ncbi:hypothetical protein [Methylobacter tundripaludum]|uniref:Phage protein n=1 Tax=Methylobacter tundripaludum (strain ATCC BAA-1195 / DSM 17260 / SV96) TaxID=697282 RepID=G3IRF6_METTV|nr:hypothetical protein [Methylobacter tundripaludum]EGW22167.1 phage protein [Methylobacter tundripaludum SV96]